MVLTKLLTKWKKHEVRIIYRKYSMPKYLQYIPLVDTAEFVHVDTLLGVFRLSFTATCAYTEKLMRLNLQRTESVIAYN